MVRSLNVSTFTFSNWCVWTSTTARYYLNGYLPPIKACNLFSNAQVFYLINLLPLDIIFSIVKSTCPYIHTTCPNIFRSLDGLPKIYFFIELLGISKLTLRAFDKQKIGLNWLNLVTIFVVYIQYNWGKANTVENQ